MFSKPLPLIAASLLSLAPTFASERLGIVMIHGKEGSPEQFSSYDALLAKQNYSGERPEMCWSGRRIYDRTFLECLRDIDEAVSRLRATGANQIVIAGQSLGANAAIAYGARHGDLTGIIAIAPAHPAEILANRPQIANSIAAARALLAQGQSDKRANFADINVGRLFTVTTTPTIYLSFFGADSAAVMPANATQLKAPLLLISPNNDPTQRGRSYIFDKAPSNPFNLYVTVNSDHLGAPAAARVVQDREHDDDDRCDGEPRRQRRSLVTDVRVDPVAGERQSEDQERRGHQRSVLRRVAVGHAGSL